jgi:hypothetical protein
MVKLHFKSVDSYTSVTEPRRLATPQTCASRPRRSLKILNKSDHVHLWLHPQTVIGNISNLLDSRETIRQWYLSRGGVRGNVHDCRVSENQPKRLFTSAVWLTLETGLEISAACSRGQHLRPLSQRTSIRSVIKHDVVAVTGGCEGEVINASD